MDKLTFSLTVNKDNIPLLGGATAPANFRFDGEITGAFPDNGVGIKGQFIDPNNGNTIIPQKIGELIVELRKRGKTSNISRSRKETSRREERERYSTRSEERIHRR